MTATPPPDELSCTAEACLPITIRLAGEAERPAVESLAELDGREAGPGPHLLAETDGVVVASISLFDGQVAADPRRPTLDATRLLALRAAQIAAAEPWARIRLRPGHA